MARRISEVLAVFEAIAPLGLAEDWDNVGLLLAPQENGEIRRVLLCIDLTEAVLTEALDERAELVLAYHPPIFKGLKRLTPADATGRILIEAMRGGVFIYSPHTALDATPGGINDWLGELLGAGMRRPIATHRTIEGVGAGRFIELGQPMPLAEAVGRIKAGLGLAQVRVAASPQHRRGQVIRSFAVCAGAGGSVFERLTHADLLLTGEMRHHDIMARVAAGSSVIVTDHTNTERGYLPRLRTTLLQRLERIEVMISEVDRDPLVIE